MREKVEKIMEIVKDVNLNELDGDYYQFFKEVKDYCENFKEIFEIYDKYNIKVKLSNFYNDYIEFYKSYGNVKISEWHDWDELLNSDVQPQVGEKLMIYEYPKGAYIFGSDYYEDIFEEFIEELKKYRYKYIDDENDKLLFEIKEGIKLFKNYDSICEKYQKKYDIESKERKRLELEKELEELKGNDK